jgi:hypothetical protein
MRVCLNESVPLCGKFGEDTRERVFLLARDTARRRSAAPRHPNARIWVRVVGSTGGFVFFVDE